MRTTYKVKFLFIFLMYPFYMLSRLSIKQKRENWVGGGDKTIQNVSGVMKLIRPLLVISFIFATRFYIQYVTQ